MSGSNLNFKYKYGFFDSDAPVAAFPKGLSENVARELSAIKGEDSWMRDFRLKSFKIFNEKKMPDGGADLSGINFDEVVYFVRPAERQSVSWDEVPSYIKNTFEKLGIPEAERKYLAGVSAQYDSEVVYHNIKSDWESKGVIFCDTDTGYKKYPEIFRKYFGMIIPPADNKLAALNSAVWSGGSFVYIPKGVKVEIPLQAYFRINAKNMGQFERTLIIAEEGASVHYIEGCTAPNYSTASLHAAVVEIIAKKGSSVRYTTVQNWSKNVYNLVTKRAFVEEEANVEWIDGNIGSKATMKYPSIFLRGPKARGSVLSLAYAGSGQHQDAGAKAIHLAPETSSRIISKSVAKDGGRASYRGMVKVIKGAKNSKSKVVCDALLLDNESRSDTYPTMDIKESSSTVEHEASVSKVGEDKIFYLGSRGIKESDALGLLVSGFLSDLTRELPMEYAAELNHLLRLEMEGSIG
ncbi:Fe-S cluster assembly protein SufB [Candidatus Woesearchaeota archaeon]|nr:Fe-S cluster assembly protein SufB [Candidatus Woesearchaeota archaeon]